MDLLRVESRKRALSLAANDVMPRDDDSEIYDDEREGRWLRVLRSGGWYASTVSVSLRADSVETPGTRVNSKQRITWRPRSAKSAESDRK